MPKVSFKEMKNGTKEDYILLDKHEKKFVEGTADRILKFMSGLTETLEGYQVSRLEHSLQSATRAYKNNESEEMIVATLLHDDVVDDATIRRGWPTINKIWKNKISILIGDYLFSKALINISKFNDLHCINILSNISQRLSEGEIFQIEKAMNKEMSEKEYLKMISDKTASLISSACYLGFYKMSIKKCVH